MNWWRPWGEQGTRVSDDPEIDEHVCTVLYASDGSAILPQLVINIPRHQIGLQASPSQRRRIVLVYTNKHSTDANRPRGRRITYTHIPPPAPCPTPLASEIQKPKTRQNTLFCHQTPHHQGLLNKTGGCHASQCGSRPRDEAESTTTSDRAPK